MSQAGKKEVSRKVWTPFKGYAVVRWSFSGSDKMHLSLRAGSGVLITEQYPGWYRGKSLESNQVGIFPSNYVKLFDGKFPNSMELKKMEFHPDIEFDDLSQEINDTLLEWKQILANIAKYGGEESKIDLIIKKFKSLLSLKEEFMDPDTTDSRRVKLRGIITTTIDRTNKSLGRRPTPRTILKSHRVDESNTDLIDMYNIYKDQEKFVRIRKGDANAPGASKVVAADAKGSHLYVGFTSIKITTDEALAYYTLEFFIYDYKNDEKVSEIFSMELDKNFQSMNRTLPNQCLFLDIDENKELYLAVNIYRYGPMVTTKKDNHKKYKRPLCGIVFQLSGSLDYYIKEFTPINIKKMYRVSDANFHRIHRMVIENSDSDLREMSDSFINLRFKFFKNKDIKAVFRENPQFDIIERANNLSLPEFVYPDYKRNDVYVTFKDGHFPTSGYGNVLVKASVRIRGKQRSRQVFYRSSSESLSDEHTGFLLFKDHRPSWNDLAKLKGMDYDDLKQSELVVKVYDCRKDEKKQDRLILMGTWEFFDDAKSIVKRNGMHRISLSKVKNQKSFQLQQYPDPGDLVEAEDYMNISFNLCSTTITQNKDLMNLFEWGSNLDKLANISKKEIEDSIDSLDLVDESLAKIFFNKISDSLLVILGKEGNLLDVKTLSDDSDVASHADDSDIGTLQNGGSDDMKDSLSVKIIEYYENIVRILLNKSSDYAHVINTYISERFSLTSEAKANERFIKTLSRVYPEIIRVLNFFIQNASVSGLGDKMRQILRAFNFLLKIIIASHNLEDMLFQRKIRERRIKLERRQKRSNMESEDNVLKKLISAREVRKKKFTASLERLITDLSALMNLTEPEWIISTQALAIREFYQMYVELPKAFSVAKSAELISDSLRSIRKGRGNIDAKKLRLIREISEGPLIRARPTRDAILPVLIPEIEGEIMGKKDEISNALQTLENIVQATEYDFILFKTRPEFYTQSEIERYRRLREKTNQRRKMYKEGGGNRRSLLLTSRKALRTREIAGEVLKKKRCHIRGDHYILEKPENTFTNLNYEEESLSSEYDSEDSEEEENKSKVRANEDSVTKESTFRDRDKDSERAEIRVIIQIVPLLLRGYAHVVEEESLKDRVEYMQRIQTILFSVFHLSPNVLEVYLESTEDRDEVKFFYETLILMLKTNPFPKEWEQLNWIIHNSILTIIKKSFYVLRKNFLSSTEFAPGVWMSYMNCILTLVGSDTIQLERKVTAETCSEVLSRSIDRFGDIRKIAVNVLKDSWFILGKKKIEFVEGLSLEFLNLMLFKNEKLWDIGFDLFYSIIQVEFEFRGSLNLCRQSTVRAIDKAMKEEKYAEFENFFFRKLEARSKAEKNEALRSEIRLFVDEVLRIADLIFGIDEEFKYANHERDEEVTFAILALLDLLRSNKQRELTIRYIIKLYEVNRRNEFYVEAAQTLLLYDEMLDWHDKEIQEGYSCVDKRYDCEAQSVYERILDGGDGSCDKKMFEPESGGHRKEKVIKLAVYMFTKGGDLLSAIEHLDRLIDYHEDETYDYDSAIDLLGVEKKLTERLKAGEMVAFPHYFYVGYYGNGFNNEETRDLMGREFVYKGELLEPLGTFIEKLKKKFPDASVISMEQLEKVNLQEYKQYITVKHVKPQFAEEVEGREVERIKGKPGYIVDYMRTTNVGIFYLETPFRVGPKDKENEFKNLWIRKIYLLTEGTFPTTHKRLGVVDKIIIELNPIENAIKAIETKNQELRDNLRKYGVSNVAGLDVNKFSMELNGTIDAVVNGGVMKYKEAFLSEEFKKEELYDEQKVMRLKEILKEHMDLLQESLDLHERIHDRDMHGIHTKMKRQLPNLKLALAEIYL